jgi:transposase
LIARLRLINSQLADAEQQLDRLCKKIVGPVDGEEGENTPSQKNEQRDAAILDSTPGIGRTVLVSLLTEASDALQRRDHALGAMCGTAPVTKRSGKSHLVLRRRACNRRLRNAVHHWAHNAVLQDATSRIKYEALRAKGHGHARALRSVADRLLNVVCVMLRTGTTFDSSLASKQASA